MGLEAGDGIDGKRSCFKASSGDHPRFTTRNQCAFYRPRGGHASDFAPLASQLFPRPVFQAVTPQRRAEFALPHTRCSLARPAPPQLFCILAIYFVDISEMHR